jgi:hypothetical protein
MSTPPDDPPEPNPLQNLAVEVENPYPMYQLKWWVAPTAGSAEQNQHVMYSYVVFRDGETEERREWFIRDMIAGLEAQGYVLARGQEASYRWIAEPDDPDYPGYRNTAVSTTAIDRPNPNKP